MIKQTLLYTLLKYKRRKMSSFHTPGHKNKFFKKLFNKLDYTELEGTDDLYNPRGAILETEKKASEIFGSGCTLISAGGCTLCIQAMLSVFCNKKSKILCSRVLHRSVINTMAILDLEPVFILPKVEPVLNFSTQITVEDVEFYLKKYKDIKAVFLTSPDYYGNMADIKSISFVCKKYNVPLLVDNAHGSHLAFLKKNVHPLFLGADAAADSLHKTLPVLTGGALLHLKDKTLYKKAKYFMEFFGSSSPSFPIMASIDLCLNWLKKHGKKEFLKLEEKVYLIKILAKNHGLLSLDFYRSYKKNSNIEGQDFFSINIGSKGNNCSNINKIKEKNLPSFIKENDLVFSCKDKHSLSFENKNKNSFYSGIQENFCQVDPTRFCFCTKSIGLTGEEVAKIFKKHKVEPEFYDENFIVLIPSPFNTKKDFHNLEKAIKSLPKRGSYKLVRTNEVFNLPKVICSLHEAVFERKSIYVNVENSIGRVAAKAENICPPGIPLIMPGEEISEEIVKILQKNKINQIKVLL